MKMAPPFSPNPWERRLPHLPLRGWFAVPVHVLWCCVCYPLVQGLSETSPSHARGEITSASSCHAADNVYSRYRAGVNSACVVVGLASLESDRLPRVPYTWSVVGISLIINFQYRTGTDQFKESSDHMHNRRQLHLSNCLNKYSTWFRSCWLLCNRSSYIQNKVSAGPWSASDCIQQVDRSFNDVDDILHIMPESSIITHQRRRRCNLLFLTMYLLGPSD